jgi:hypothetical protein
MEKRMTPLELKEFLGGERKATALLDRIIQTIISKDEDLNKSLNCENKIAFTSFYTLISVADKGDFGLAMFCEVHREVEENHNIDHVTPLLIYVTDTDSEMPDCALDMISLQKRMESQDKLDGEWLFNEMEKFK